MGEMPRLGNICVGVTRFMPLDLGDDAFKGQDRVSTHPGTNSWISIGVSPCFGDKRRKWAFAREDDNDAIVYV